MRRDVLSWEPLTPSFLPLFPGLFALHVHHSQRPEFTQLPDQVGELHLCSPQHAAPLLIIFLPWFSPYDVASLVGGTDFREAFSALNKGASSSHWIFQTDLAFTVCSFSSFIPFLW